MKETLRKEQSIKHLFAVTLLAATVFVGCGSKDVVQNITPEDRFQLARTLFDNGEYLEAINEFTIITLQYQGSAFAGDAQFYLAECRFNRGEYLVASFEYQTLKRNMAASPRVPEGQYKLGLCFYLLSPKSRLDQQYTKRAIDALQEFVEYYPKSEFVPDATEKIKELTTRLAKKEYETAQLYSTMEYNKAAIFYYDNVIEKYHDTEYAPLAYLGKTELLIARNKFRDAKTVITKFLEKFPNSVLRSRADKLSEQIDAELKGSPAASGKESGSTKDSSPEANLLRVP